MVLPSHATDIAQVGSLDWESQRAEGRAECENMWDAVRQATQGLPALVPWESYMERIVEAEDFEEKASIRESYHEQPVLKALRLASPEAWELDDQLACLTLDREQVARRMSYFKGSCRAYVHQGQWHERGEMGWFGMSSGDKPHEEWYESVGNMMDSLPETHWVTVVDCHI